VSTAPSRILIVRLSHLGDVVHALPVYHALRGAYPRARIAWAVQPEFAALVAGLPGLERAIPFQRGGGARAWPRLARELEAFGADWSVDCQGNTKSAFVALASRAGRRSGLARADWREPFAATSVTDAAPAREQDGAGVEHAVERMLRLARHVAPEWDSPPSFDVGLSAEERARGESQLATLVGGTGGVLMHVAAEGDVRSWPAKRFETLARELAQREPVLVVSGPAEESEGCALSSRVVHARVAHLVGQRGLRELAALFTAAARRGMRFIGCDSGPMHVAWASGMPVVLLAGPQDQRRTGAWPPARSGAGHHKVVRASHSPPCAPCLARSCHHPEGPVCMTRINIVDVMRTSG